MHSLGICRDGLPEQCLAMCSGARRPIVIVGGCALSRQVDLSKPDEWTDEDVEYLRQRPESVPAEYRDRLVSPVIAPAQEAESPEIARLRAFLERHYPDDIAVEGDTPVGVAIRLLSEDVDEDEEATDDGYDTWSAADIKAEVDKRRDAGRTIEPASNRKADYIAALREDDKSA